MTGNDALLRVRDLRTLYSVRGSFVDRLRGHEAGAVKAVDGVSFDLHAGEVLGVVGESGSGKTTLGRTLMGLVEANDGSIEFDGSELVGLSETELRPYRRRLQIVFQDPHASLNPALTIGDAVGDPLRFHGIAGDREEAEPMVAEVLEAVGLAPAGQFVGKYPSDLSGGQKQRASLARAIILRPSILIADEPVSMLDMSVRAKILELMLTLKREFSLTYLYITHDLATAKFFCDRIAIMYLGKIVEIGPADAIYENPRHPYTQALLRAIPDPDPERSVPRDLPRGEVPDAIMPPLGCSFHPRCPKAFEVCGWESRDLRNMLETRWTELSEEDYDAERKLVGNLDELDEPAPEAVLPAGAGHSGEDAAGVVEELRSAHPDDPFWRGISEQRVERDGVHVRFHEPIDPRDVEADGSLVQCHLYDQEALAAAERARGAATPR
jgi:oligopeptide/dipeptide ABC transporter ATP-binding protein